MPLEPLPDLVKCPPDYRLIPAGIHDAKARAFLAALWGLFCLPIEDNLNLYDFENQDITVINQLIDQWDLTRFIEPFMTDDDLRTLAKQGLLLHRLSGTKAGINLALEIADVSGNIDEWWQTGGDVHTFNIVVFFDENLAKGRDFNDPIIIENLRRLVDQAKPVRSGYEVQVVQVLTNDYWVGSSFRSATQYSLDMAEIPPAEIQSVEYSVGATFRNRYEETLTIAEV